MSTHYGRMIHQDDRTIMFANPEDAAEYLGFDLIAGPSPSAPAWRGLDKPRAARVRRKVVFAPVALSR